jgi:acyl-CoA thioesterase FadM
MDALYREVGVDEAYRAAGHMFYTVESHATYLGELKAGDTFAVTTRVLSLEAKRLRVLHCVHRSVDDALVATGEQMHVHVAVHAGKSVPMPERLHAQLLKIHDAEAREPWPAQAGRSVGQSRD